MIRVMTACGSRRPCPIGTARFWVRDRNFYLTAAKCLPFDGSNWHFGRFPKTRCDKKVVAVSAPTKLRGAQKIIRFPLARSLSLFFFFFFFFAETPWRVVNRHGHPTKRKRRKRKPNNWTSLALHNVAFRCSPYHEKKTKEQQHIALL